MKRSPLRSHGKSETAKCKLRIQELLRQLALLRDGGCVLWPLAGTGNIPYCHSQDTKDGHMVMQYDHLNSRQFNVSFADLRLGVILCQGHHKWKHSSKRNEKEYDALIRQIIGLQRADFWDRAENDRKIYSMGLWEWTKVELALTQDLARARAALPK
jgi:hypothetical protein